ncbi:hypothetical protein TSUD_119180 [Trifolium subterraneum]|uniref:Annexin n=1 Tax=Trifolium subterraneum TaxID=3900 RepID=A0A2Z6NSA2_TRISU|nr:hypothetical protein TSUD_119180 [Trifolium subterraneum]
MLYPHATASGPTSCYNLFLQNEANIQNTNNKYYEKVLRNAMETVGTDEDALMRVIVTRAEKDLENIRKVYYKRNSVHLEHSMAKKTSGDYTYFDGK